MKQQLVTGKLPNFTLNIFIKYIIFYFSAMLSKCSQVSSMLQVASSFPILPFFCLVNGFPFNAFFERLFVLKNLF